MDEFEKRLKRDAHALQAEISPELKARIDASLKGVEPVKASSVRHGAPTSLWLASSLTGLAAVVVLVIVANISKPDPDPIPENAVVIRTEPPLPIDLPLISPDLNISSADFTGPLEEELLKLQADMQKVRENVRKDVDFTF